MQCGSAEATESLKSTFDQIQDGGQRPSWTQLNRNNSAADRSILLKLGTWMQYEFRGG